MKTNLKISDNELLINAAREKNLQELKNCVQSKYCSIDFSDKDGLNALHLATLNNDLEMVKYLLKQNMCINSRSNLNRTPLHYACQNGYYELAKLLIENNSDINAIDFLNMTPLHVCMEKNYTQIAKLLCQNKNINLDICDKFDRTCFKIASNNQNQEMISILNELQDELKKQSQSSNHTGQNTSNLDITTGLAEFYKKKSFARPLNKSTKMNISNLYETDLAQDVNKPCSSSLKMTNEINKTNSILNNILIEDTTSDSEDEFYYDAFKKKRLSTSPLNLIDSNLNWMTNQTVMDLSKFELSLTDAGKLTLNYLNKNDPVKDETRLLMKLINEFENNNDNKIDCEEEVDGDSEVQNQFLNMISNTESNEDDLKFLDNFSFFNP